MKKNGTSFILIILILFLSISGFSQSLSLSWEGEPLGDTILVTGFNPDSEIVAHAIVSNDSDHSLDVKVRRDHLQMIEGALSQFCWGFNCYPPNVIESPGFLTLGPGQSTAEEQFSGHYLPMGNFGDSFIEYEFFNMNNQDENVKVIVHFTITTVGIQEHALNVKIYPNPASANITILLPHSIEEVMVYNCAGAKLMEERVNSNSCLLDISSLSSGLYYLRIISQNEVIVKQIVIK